MEMDSIKHEYRRHRCRRSHARALLQPVEPPPLLAATRRLLRRVAIRVSSVYSYACELYNETLQQAVAAAAAALAAGRKCRGKNQHN